MVLEPPTRPQLNTNQEQLCWQGYYFPVLFLSSLRRNGSEETRGSREIKAEELERKGAEKTAKEDEIGGEDRENTERKIEPKLEVVGKKERGEKQPAVS